MAQQECALREMKRGGKGMTGAKTCQQNRKSVLLCKKNCLALDFANKNSREKATDERTLLWETLYLLGEMIKKKNIYKYLKKQYCRNSL